jgi:drug/metabolite transporter (DMT)-like permease
MHRLAPGAAAGVSLGISDALAKIVFAAGCDVLTLLSFRSVVGLVFVASWLRFGRKPSADARVRWISMGIGIMFAGLIFCLFKALAAIDVSTAVLSYFAYPLLTGLAASLFGLERLRWQGLAACCRTGVLLVTRAYLVGADARLTTWYSMLSSTAIFLAASFATQTWNGPQTTLGWTVLVGVSLATTAGILFIFVSTMRIGPFRTALIMHLEPLTAMIVSAIVLGEVITPIQGIGSAIMLAALVAFQLLR